MQKKVVIRKGIILLFTVMFFVILNVVISYSKYYAKGPYEGNNEFLRTMNCAPIFDKNPEECFTISFDAKAEVPGRLRVYQQNGSKQRYSFIEYIDVSDTFTSYSINVKPELVDETEKDSYLAFYGDYGSGVIPTVRNIKIEVDER